MVDTVSRWALRLSLAPKPKNRKPKNRVSARDHVFCLPARTATPLARPHHWDGELDTSARTWRRTGESRQRASASGQGRQGVRRGDIYQAAGHSIVLHTPYVVAPSTPHLRVGDIDWKKLAATDHVSLRFCYTRRIVPGSKPLDSDPTRRAQQTAELDWRHDVNTALDVGIRIGARATKAGHARGRQGVTVFAAASEAIADTPEWRGDIIVHPQHISAFHVKRHDRRPTTTRWIISAGLRGASDDDTGTWAGQVAQIQPTIVVAAA
ncbi:hypothetical protein BD779DRAFT_1471873 [Infundibulicybe gibba]|nr:hypothetical protein BD779DRAFT_1471873 [Infundibulicybe gibba]